MTNQSSDAKATLKVLFVCVQNSNRSQMAEAFARTHGKGFLKRTVPVRARRVNLKAIEAMRELGYDLSLHRSKGLSEITDIEYDYAITMGWGRVPLCASEVPRRLDYPRSETNVVR